MKNQTPALKDAEQQIRVLEKGVLSAFAPSDADGGGENGS